MQLLDDEVDIDGRVDRKRPEISYIGKATRVSGTDNRYRTLANVGGALCLVEVRLTVACIPARTTDLDRLIIEVQDARP